MSDRENLIDILKQAPFEDKVLDDWWLEEKIKMIADHLIMNGVTVQEWISVKDRLPENVKEGLLIALRWGAVDIGWCEDGRWGSEFVDEYEDGEVTHWMPLPKPPKGE